MTSYAADAGGGSLIAELEGHLDTICEEGQQQSWLSKQASCALACLVTACALRPGVELKQAIGVAERGLGFTGQGLDAEGVDLEVCLRGLHPARSSSI